MKTHRLLMLFGQLAFAVLLDGLVSAQPAPSGRAEPPPPASQTQLKGGVSIDVGRPGTPGPGQGDPGGNGWFGTITVERRLTVERSSEIMDHACDVVVTLHGDAPADAAGDVAAPRC